MTKEIAKLEKGEVNEPKAEPNANDESSEDQKR